MPVKYDKDLKAKAVRLVVEHAGDYGSQWAATCAVSSRLGMTAETLRRWVGQTEIDSGKAPGLSSESAVELRRLRRKCR